MGSNPVRLRPGQQPYDRINGMRIGALAGGFLGALVAASTGMAWPIVAGAIVGGGVGFWSGRNGVSGTPDAQPPESSDGS